MLHSNEPFEFETMHLCIASTEILSLTKFQALVQTEAIT